MRNVTHQVNTNWVASYHRDQYCGRACARPEGHAWPREAGTRLQSGALLTKDEPSQLIAQLLDMFRIIGRAEAFGQLEECLFFLLAGLDSLLDKFHQDAVIAEIAFPGQGFNLFR